MVFYVYPKPGGFFPGESVRIKVIAQDSFSINFQDNDLEIGYGNVGYHLRIEVNSKSISNARFIQCGGWGEGENVGDVPVKKNDLFEVVIYCEINSFRVNINGNYCCTYNYRLPLNSMKCLRPKGAGEIVSLAIEGEQAGSGRMCTISQWAHDNIYWWPKPDGFENNAVTLYGKTPSDGKKFTINFQNNDSLFDDNRKIGFQLVVQLVDEQVLNNWPDPNTMLLQKGQRFRIAIHCRKGQFEVVVNYPNSSTYDIRTAFDDMKYLFLQGDVVLTEISINKNVSRHDFDRSVETAFPFGPYPSPRSGFVK